VTWLDQLLKWRAVHEQWVSEWSFLQKESEKSRDFQMAKYYSELKRESLRAAKSNEKRISFERGY